MSFTKISKQSITNLYNFENYDKVLFKSFIQNNNIVSWAQTHPCFASWDYYLQKGGDIGSKRYNEGLPPYFDHAYAFKTKNKYIYFVYQPYYRPEEINDDVMKWANEVGINCRIYDKQHSWYNKNQTCLVILYSTNTKEPIVL